MKKSATQRERESGKKCVKENVRCEWRREGENGWEWLGGKWDIMMRDEGRETSRETVRWTAVMWCSGCNHNCLWVTLLCFLFFPVEYPATDTNQAAILKPLHSKRMWMKNGADANLCQREERGKQCEMKEEAQIRLSSIFSPEDDGLTCDHDLCVKMSTKTLNKNGVSVTTTLPPSS